ncbi:MAG: hypothetical protein HYW05_01565 [Candidatus Diapherotrites archaeon]|nr:hypothetical protein [Candidatus Diapherotrites archaeon]
MPGKFLNIREVVSLANKRRVKILPGTVSKHGARHILEGAEPGKQGVQALIRKRDALKYINWLKKNWVRSSLSKKSLLSFGDIVKLAKRNAHTTLMAGKFYNDLKKGLIKSAGKRTVRGRDCDVFRERDALEYIASLKKGKYQHISRGSYKAKRWKEEPVGYAGEKITDANPELRKLRHELKQANIALARVNAQPNLKESEWQRAKKTVDDAARKLREAE